MLRASLVLAAATTAYGHHPTQMCAMPKEANPSGEEFCEVTGPCGTIACTHGGVYVVGKDDTAASGNFIIGCAVTTNPAGSGAGLPPVAAGFGSFAPYPADTSEVWMTLTGSKPCGEGLLAKSVCEAQGRGTASLALSPDRHAKDNPSAALLAQCPRPNLGSAPYTVAEYNSWYRTLPGYPWGQAMARRDPHLWFAHGGRADFRGEDGAVYNLLSAANTSFNVRIAYADFHTRSTLVHGSYMASAYWTIRSKQSGRQLAIEFNATSDKATASVREHASNVVLRRGDSLTVENVKVSLTNDKELSVTTDKWSMAAKVSSFPFANRNKDSTLLDVKISPVEGYSPEADVVAPHGIIGQSYDADQVGISGAIDEPVTAASPPEVTTKAQAEGAIEGTISDYRLKAPHATAFKFSRFAATEAKPRDVTKLTGTRVTIPIAHMRTAGAGAAGNALFNAAEEGAPAAGTSPLAALINWITG